MDLCCQVFFQIFNGGVFCLQCLFFFFQFLCQCIVRLSLGGPHPGQFLLQHLQVVFLFLQQFFLRNELRLETVNFPIQIFLALPCSGFLGLKEFCCPLELIRQLLLSLSAAGSQRAQ